MATACQGFLKSQGKTSSRFILLPEGTFPQITALIDLNMKLEMLRNIGAMKLTVYCVREGGILEFSFCANWNVLLYMACFFCGPVTGLRDLCILVSSREPETVTHRGKNGN
jgi:hypothetical protein